MRVRENTCVCARIHWVLHPIFMRARKKRTNPRTRTLVCMRHNGYLIKLCTKIGTKWPFSCSCSKCTVNSTLFEGKLPCRRMDFKLAVSNLYCFIKKHLSKMHGYSIHIWLKLLGCHGHQLSTTFTSHTLCDLSCHPLWPILTSVRFLICENFQKYNLILFPMKTFKYIK